MNTGDRIKIFEDTNRLAYIDMIHDMGFNCHVRRNFIIIGERRRMSEKDKREIGRKITKAMKEKNMSRDDVAKEVGVTSYTVWNWQLGRSVPSIFNQEILKIVLGVEI